MTDGRANNQAAAAGNDRWFVSPVSGLLFTGNAATPTCRAVGVSLLLGDAGAFDHRRPFADVAGEAGLQLLGRAGLGFDPKLGIALLHLGRRHDLVNRLVQERDDVRRRAVRSEHALPRNHLLTATPPLPHRPPLPT